MTTPMSLFLDFNLPNATTWLYFSFLLAIALYFKFSRLFSIRNLDVVMLFLLAPGLLYVQAPRPQRASLEQLPALHVAALIGEGALEDTPGLATRINAFARQCGPQLENQYWLWYAYLWLLVGSGFFFCRCLIDLTLVQRPALGPNLQIGGLAWLAGTLLICLLAVAYRQAERYMDPARFAASGSVLSTEAGNQAVFAVAVLWRHWPAWSVATLAFACHIIVMGGLILIGWRHFQDLSAGMAAATFYVMLPYTGLQVGQLHHVLPMALFIGTLLLFRWPTLAGGILGIASAATYFPALVLPLWLSFYRYRGAGRFVAAFFLGLALGLVNIGMTLWLNDELDYSVQLALESAAWQPQKIPAMEGIWTRVHWAYRIPVFLLFLFFVFTTMFWPSPKNLAHVIALSAAVFIGMQFWWADQGGIYVMWYIPLMLLMIFRPNLQDRVAPPILADTDWLTLSWRWTIRLLRRLVNRPEPAQTNAA